jgi:hypothetical protein
MGKGNSCAAANGFGGDGLSGQYGRDIVRIERLFKTDNAWIR